MTKTVLVTGATGFVAGYVINAFIEGGWKVKGTVRDVERSHFLTARYTKEKLELVQVKDIVTGEGLQEAMVGVDAVAHTASPLNFSLNDPLEDVISPAVDGTLSVLKAAKAAGVKRIVVTSSFAAVIDPSQGGAWRDYTYTDKDWNPSTVEDAIAPGASGAFVYLASKALAERAAHDFASANELELVALCPPMIYGAPLAPVKSKAKLSQSVSRVYALIDGAKGRAPPPTLFPQFCSAEDVALAHVRALEASAGSVAGAGGGRFLLHGGSFTWEDAIRHLQKVRPELKHRLPIVPKEERGKGTMARMDVSPARELLGMSAYKSWEETVEETIDALVELEKQFK